MFCPSCAKQIPEESQFCPGCGKTINVVAGLPPSQLATQLAQRGMPGRTRTALILLAALVALVILAVYNQSNRITAAGSAPSLLSHEVAKVEKLASGQIVVPAGNISSVRFTVTPAMSHVRVVGRFNATGGTGNDIDAVVAGEDAFENWKNGHQAPVVYASGKATVGNVNAAIAMPGTYYLAFSNTFSAFTGKTVSAEIALHYTVRE